MGSGTQGALIAVLFLLFTQLMRIAEALERIAP